MRAHGFASVFLGVMAWLVPSLPRSIGRTLFRQRVALWFFSCIAISGAVAQNAARPNIVVILVDDMGWSDLGCYGSEITTPNLDRLAQNGVRFTQFYNTARCCPTRAALLTGLYPHQAGVGHMTEERKGADGKPLPGYSGHLNDQCVTIAEALKAAGYFTAMAGKWHVGQNHGVIPSKRGFDRSLNAAAGGFYFNDSPRTEIFLDGKSLGRTDDPLPKQWYSTDLWTQFGLQFVDEALETKRPFFLYVAHNAPHFPLQAPADEIAKWRGKFKAGWDKLREARHQRQIEMGLVDKAWPLSPRLDVVPAWESLGPAEQERYDHIMAIYAAVVHHMDAAVGRLIDGLNQRGVLDNTLVLFMSDNGGNAESGVPGRIKGEHPGDAKSDVFVGQCWATLNNTPFVRYKHFTDEGGIATPLIAHWPAGISTARQGKLEAQPGHVIDIMATCLDVAGANYPKEFGGKPITPLEGASLRPAFEGKEIARLRPLFWEHEGNRAVRDGQWKLVALEGKPWRLFDLAADRTELHDLAEAQPDRVKALSGKWEEYAARANVLPLGGWRTAAVAGAKPVLSKETRFALKEGDHLEREQAPAIAHRGLTITAKFDLTRPDGVIVAQGGNRHGYALFLEKGKLVFLTRVGGTPASVAIDAVANGAHTAVAHIAQTGAMTLTLDGNATITSPNAAQIFSIMPTDGLDVGADEGGLVGPYPDRNPFSGTIDSVVITLDPQ